MTRPELPYDSENIFGDLALAHRAREALEPVPVVGFLASAKNLVFDALSGIIEHPIGAAEIGTAGALGGLAAAGAVEIIRFRRR